jgi:pimeloyl-ACP methyl ester carboxylesterase
MEYDPRRSALYHPERDDPVEDFGAAWPVDSICAELSRLAYYRFEQGDKPRLDSFLAKGGFAESEPFRDVGKSAEGFATAAPDGTIFVAFRGTQPDALRDLLVDADARFAPSPAGAGRVHNGFSEAYASLAQDIDRWLAPQAGRRLVVTGHSLGAAMATIMAALHRQAELVTFGSPCVGDGPFAESFAARSVRRYLDCTDLVTRLLPAFTRYVHVGPLRYIDRSGRVRTPPPPEAEIASDRRSAALAYPVKYGWKVWRNVAIRELADHAPVNYISAVLGRREGG